jgi:glyoxylase I family protein
VTIVFSWYLADLDKLETGSDMFNRLHHVAIICSDYVRSKRFYVEILGFEVVRETHREKRRSFKLDLRLGDTCQIELFSFHDPPKRISSPEACGLRHIAFAVDNVKAVAEHLTSKGIAVEPIRVDEFTNKPFTFFRDPDNLPIEVYEE